MAPLVYSPEFSHHILPIIRSREGRKAFATNFSMSFDSPKKSKISLKKNLSQERLKPRIFMRSALHTLIHKSMKSNHKRSRALS
jgi:hypothetical protein